MLDFKHPITKHDIKKIARDIDGRAKRALRALAKANKGKDAEIACLYPRRGE